MSPLPIDAAVAPVSFASDVIVIKARGLASTTNASWRALRRIVAARRGQVELANTYGEIALVVDEVVSGQLFDPDYAKRPAGANRLAVTLVDEAAYVASIMRNRDSYGGTWHLTQLADGTLVASAIEDTPWEPSLVAGRGMLIAKARADLRAGTVERRLAGLDMLQQHELYELVPDVIPLLEDTRNQGGRNIGQIARLVLSGFAAAIGDQEAPADSAIEAWTKYWNDRFTQLPPLPAIPQGTVTEHVRVFAHQSWPDITAAANGIVVGVSQLEHAFDGTQQGIFVTKDGARTWLVREPFEDLAVAGTGMVWADAKSRWHFTTTTGKPASLPDRHARAIVNVIAPAGDGFLVLGIKRGKHLLAALLDANGKQRRAHPLMLPFEPDPNMNQRAIDVVPRPSGGWLAAVSTAGGVLAVAIDDELKATSTTISRRGSMEPRVAVGRDRALVTWAVSTVLEVQMVGLDGKPVAPVADAGTMVTFVAQPVALADGFAIAWIEDYRDIHLGRFDRDGALVSDVVVQAGRIGPFGVHLARDGEALLVSYLDQSRYPYPIVTKRL